MDVTDFIQAVNDAFRGGEDAPTDGTEDWDYWLRVANRKKNEWAKDPKQYWSSLFEVREMGTIAAGTQTYDMDDDLLRPSDSVIVTDTNSSDHPFTLVKPQQRDRVTTGAYISGRDPQVLTFIATIQTNDQIVGGTLKVPAYFLPDDLSSAADTIPVDDPFWLVMATAAEIAFNDITYEDKYPDLNAKANALWSQMVTANRNGTALRPRTVPTRGVRINDISQPGLSTNGDW